MKGKTLIAGLIIFITCCQPLHAQPDLEKIALWSMDEGTGISVSDVSGKGHHGTLIGDITSWDWVAGIHGTGIHFHGTDRYPYVRIPNHPDLQFGTGSFTVEAWAKVESWVNNGYGEVVLGTNWSSSAAITLSFVLDGPTDRKAVFRVQTGTDNAVISKWLAYPGHWYHLVGVRDEDLGVIRIYVNGHLAGEKTDLSGSLSSTNWSLSGQHTWIVVNPVMGCFHGILDEVAVYGRALNEAEIKKNYQVYRPNLNYPYISRRTTVVGGIHGSTTLGCAWGDYDGDGDEDLFVANDWFKKNYLFRNNGDGTFKQMTRNQLMLEAHSSACGSWGDMDNDGDLDLFVVNRNGENNCLYRNIGDGSFEKVTNDIVVQDGASSNAAAWADYDNDGFLDLFVANKNGENNLLYQNNGNGSFSKIIEGDIVNDDGDSRGCVWGDYNDDGFVDLFVANRSQQNNFLYQNLGDGTFQKILDMDVVTDGGSSWSGSWGDYDNDGDLDLYVANNDEANFMYQNEGGVLNRVTITNVTTDIHPTRGSSWGDLDKDGNLDLIVTTRFNKSIIYKNKGDGRFRRYFIPGKDDARGVACNDLDNDGDLDMFLCKNGETNSLYVHHDNDNHWIKIRCAGNASNKSAIGAKVIITSQLEGRTITQMQEISGQTGCGGQNSLIASFGLGDATSIDKVRIEWPSGIVWESDQVEIDQVVTVEEPEMDVVLPLDQNESEGDVVIVSDVVDGKKVKPKTYRFYQNHPNPFNPETSMDYEMPQSGHVQIKIYDLNGKLVSSLVDNVQAAGHYEIQWYGTNDSGQQMPSGVYVSRFVAGGVVQTKKMILMR